MDGNDCYQEGPLYRVGTKVRYINKGAPIHNRLAIIIGTDGMGLYELQFDDDCPAFQTAAYWELECIKS